MRVHPTSQYGRHLVDGEDLQAVHSALTSDFLTTGPFTEKFENEFAKVVDAGFAVSCSSGTAALHLACLALGLGPGDQVIVPTITFVATAHAVRYTGAEVVFADVDPNSGLMRLSDLKEALTRTTTPRAVMPVYLAGQAPQMEEIFNFCRQHDLMVVEDACHAPGTIYPSSSGPVNAGSCHHADMAVFSFHPVKTIAMGEGGIVTTNEKGLADALKKFRSHGVSKETADFSNEDLAFDLDEEANGWYYEVNDLGFNYRASEIHCALGLSQLKKLSDRVTHRQKLRALYDRELEKLAPHVRLSHSRNPDLCSWHLCVVLIEFEKLNFSRNKVMKDLRDRGVGSQVHYIPVHLQPFYRAAHSPVLEGAGAYYEKCLTLPLNPLMDEDDVVSVCQALAGVLGLDR